jgi:hypothetical protein
MLLAVKRREGELPDAELYERVDAWWREHAADYGN